MIDNENLNLAIWNAVQTTDPAYTKPFSRGGGFKGTATNATYLAKKATEQFGPCGLGWGINVLDERLLQGAPIGDGIYEQVHRVHIRLWYKLGEQRGEIEHFGQTTFVGKNRNGYYTDEEAPKKSLTDAMSKALSLLGFAADIHMGMYDDSRYVSDLRQQREDERKPPTNGTKAPATEAKVGRSPTSKPDMAGSLREPISEPLAQRIETDLIAMVHGARNERELSEVSHAPNNIRAFNSLPHDAQDRVINAIQSMREDFERGEA